MSLSELFKPWLGSCSACATPRPNVALVLQYLQALRVSLTLSLKKKKKENKRNYYFRAAAAGVHQILFGASSVRPSVLQKKACLLAAHPERGLHSRPVLRGGETIQKHTFSAFWLRSSVVSVLISLISGTWRMASHEFK